MTSIADTGALADREAQAPPAYRLKRSMLGAFVGPCLPLAALGLPLVVFLPPFYASFVGVPLATVGAIFMLLRLADIAVDPVLGALMDNTRSRWGRFRPWLVASTPILMLGSYAIFMVEKGSSATLLAVWLGVLYIGYSMAVLGQTAWAGVLSSGYHERSRVYAWWQGANVFGMVLVLALPALVQSLRPGDPSVGVRAMGWFVIVMLPITIALAALRTPEPTAPVLRTPVGWKTYLRLMKRPALARILLADFTLSFAGGTTGALFLFMFHDAKGFNAAQSNLLLLIYFLGGLAGTTVWTSMARRFGKHRALAATCGYYVVSQICVQLLPDGNMMVAVPGLFLAGLAYASAPILLRAMTADAGDESRLDTGEDRTGVLYALVTSTSKVGYAFSVGLTYPLLSAVGFDAKAGAANSAGAIRGLELIFMITPIVMALLTMAIIAGYKLDAQRHGAVRDALDRRDKAAADATAVPRHAVSGEIAPIERLRAIMARLRDPESGCPWDLQQSFASIAPYTIEEAYEVADAIERNDLGDLKEELGDLLLQVVFHARMAEEAGAFAFDDVADAISAKMVRRHPHVFADARFADVAEQSADWETLKAAERAAKGDHRAGVLDDVPAGLPALLRAVKLTKRAARVGFDWPSTAEVLEKLQEELAELEVEIDAADQAKAREEFGDLLFVMANLARKLDIDPEDALRAANAKFTRRFHHIETRLAENGRKPEDSDLAEMDALWDDAKRVERGG